MYAAPRDMLTLLKIQHRNLWTAHAEQSHHAHHVRSAGMHDEGANQQQLLECNKIKSRFLGQGPRADAETGYDVGRRTRGPPGSLLDSPARCGG